VRKRCTVVFLINTFAWQTIKRIVSINHITQAGHITPQPRKPSAFSCNVPPTAAPHLLPSYDVYGNANAKDGIGGSIVHRRIEEVDGWLQ
jgi:hypothetical protein